jgi:hypothetical protein
VLIARISAMYRMFFLMLGKGEEWMRQEGTARSADPSYLRFPVEDLNRGRTAPFCLRWEM